MDDMLSQRKRPLAGWVWSNTRHMDFETVFCPFTGWPSIPAMFKEQGKGVITTDLLEAHYHLARALVENDSTVLDPFDVDRVLEENPSRVQLMEGMCNAYGVAPEHGAWLDNLRSNINSFADPFKRSMALAVALRSIRYLMSFDDETRSLMPDDDPAVSFNYFVEFMNQRVFANGQACEAHNRDAHAMAACVGTDAMYFYLPSAAGFENLNAERRMMELFVHYSTESALDTHLQGRTAALGAPVPDGAAYEKNIDAFLEQAGAIPIWIVGYNEAGLIPVSRLADMVGKHRRNLMVLEHPVLQAHDDRHTEYLLIAHP